MDSLVISLLSIFGGASLTAGAGLFGAWVQGRREHRRWLREQRYEVYLEVIGVVNVLHDIPVETRIELAEAIEAGEDGDGSVEVDDELKDSVRALGPRFDEIRASFYLLGPDRVTSKLDGFLDHLYSADDGPRDTAKQRLLDSMRRELSVRY